jgi:predicted ATPase
MSSIPNPRFYRDKKYSIQRNPNRKLKSIQKLKLELRHFTVLIGENGSGKSNILVKDWDKQIEVLNFEGIHRVGFSITED